MNNTEIPVIGAEITYTAEDILQTLWMLLSSSKLPEDFDWGKYSEKHPQFEKIVKAIFDIRDLSFALSRGDLQKFVDSKGFILSNMKAMQSNLKHLTWQTKKIAEGDFSQKVDFLGEFSESFNEMTKKLGSFSTEMTKLANLDTLTQVPNRLSIVRFLEQAFYRFTANNEIFSVIMIDLDFFKKINDAYGHDAGDIVLIETSKIISRQFRATDMFGRYGGEEFLAVLPNATADIAEKTANRALKAIAEAKISVSKNVALNITVSIGVSQSKEGDVHYNDVIKRSDRALYTAKENGRNRIVVNI